ncbi:MAG: cell division protein FtsZ, partial [Blastocatellia bacterium]
AMDATQRAISSPLLEEASINGAKGVLVNITGGGDLTLFEFDEAMRVIHDAADPDANIITGMVTDERMQNEMKITVIATGFESQKSEKVHNMPVRQTSAGGANLNSAQPRINPPSSGSIPVRTDADLEIPTFMRKKAD